MKTLTVEIDDQLHEMLDRISGADGKKASIIVQEALADRLEEIDIAEAVIQRASEDSELLSNAEVWSRLGLDH